ncbi:MAG: toxic anion resistance protein [Rhodobacteraceae bacterium]|nr:toxic anion resistance protein [Paracoccaceae bacterium]
MSEEIRANAERAAKMVDKVNAVVLAEPISEIVPLAKADKAKTTEIETRMAEVDITDTQTIVAFGNRAQSGLQKISQSMLDGVRNKDVGPAGDALRNMVTSIRGFEVSELDVRRKRNLWEFLTGRAAPFARFLAKFETVEGQIDKITGELLEHEHTLMKDIRSLDNLYARTLEFYDELGLYIAAGEAVLAKVDEIDIPAKEGELEKTAEDDKVKVAQELRDIRSGRDDLERRVHDLKLTRQVTMQSLPSIRLVQENDKSLITKINSTLMNTVPLWESQLAQAITIQRSAEAAKVVKEASDLTNELLEANAANLKQANKVIRTETERGVFDIESVKKANADLIATIEESLQIADEGKARRATAEVELKKMESDLRDTLAAAKARRSNTGATIGEAVPE